MSKAISVTLDERNISQARQRSEFMSWEVDRCMSTMYSIYEHYLSKCLWRFSEEEQRKMSEVLKDYISTLRFSNADTQSQLVIMLLVSDGSNDELIKKLKGLQLIERLALVDHVLKLRLKEEEQT